MLRSSSPGAASWFVRGPPGPRPVRDWRSPGREPIRSCSRPRHPLERTADCCSHAPPAARDVRAAPLAPDHLREGGQALDRSAAADALPPETALLDFDTDFELHRLSDGPGDAAVSRPTTRRVLVVRTRSPSGRAAAVTPHCPVARNQLSVRRHDVTSCHVTHPWSQAAASSGSASDALALVASISGIRSAVRGDSRSLRHSRGRAREMQRGPARALTWWRRPGPGSAISAHVGRRGLAPERPAVGGRGGCGVAGEVQSQVCRCSEAAAPCDFLDRQFCCFKQSPGLE